MKKEFKLEMCVVEIRDDERTLGTGFVVSMEGLIATCHHVIKGTANVKIYFHQAKKEMKASVLPQYQLPEDDVSFILVDGPLPPEVQVAPLGNSKEIQGLEFWSRGYRKVADYECPLASGVIMGTVSKLGQRYPSLQLDSKYIETYMSGAPIFTPTMGRVVGMIKSFIENRPEKFGVMAEALVAACPSLRLLPPEEPHRLLTPLADVSSACSLVATLPLPPAWNNMHNPPKVWIDRVDKLDDINNFWSNPKARVLGLVGWGGMGKSSLVYSWCQQATERDIHPDGVFWWTFQEGEGIEKFLHEALDYMIGYNKHKAELLPPMTTTMVHFLAAMLKSGRFLFVLDGLETLQNTDVHSTEFGRLKNNNLREFLRAWMNTEFHDSRCLITSRIPLIDLMSYPAYCQIEVDRLSIAEGVELFKNYGVTGDIGAIKATVESYGGHPQALSLLTQWLIEYEHGDIAQVGKIPQPLKDEKRYRSVHTILRYYDTLLNNEEHTFLNIFSVIRTPLTKDMLDFVFLESPPKGDPLNIKLAAMPKYDFKDLVNGLTKLRLIQYVGPDDSFMVRHCVMLPLIREFYKSLLAKDALVKIYRRLKEYYLAEASRNRRRREILEEITGMPMPRFGIGLRVGSEVHEADELGSLIEATQHACYAGDYDEAFDIYRNGVHEGQWTLVHQLGAYDTDLALVRGFFPEDDLEQRPLVSNIRDQTSLINQVGFCLMMLGQPAKAAPFFRRSGRIEQEEICDPVKAFDSYTNLGEVLIQVGDLRKASEVTADLSVLAQRISQSLQREEQEVKQYQIRVILFEAWIAHLQGRKEDATQSFKNGEALQQEFDGSKFLPINGGIWYAAHLIAIGNLEQAETILKWNLEICERFDYLMHVIACKRLIGDVARLRRNFDPACNWYNEAIDSAREIGLRYEMTQILLGRGLLWLLQDQYKQANDDLIVALDLSIESEYSLIEAEIRLALCRLKLALDDPVNAGFEAHQALDIAKESGYY